jgi:hypothetical protein
MGEGRIHEYQGRPLTTTLELKRGKKVTIPSDCRGPILVFVGEKPARYRFRGTVHKPQTDKCVTYAKLNRAEETIEVLDGIIEVSF